MNIISCPFHIELNIRLNPSKTLLIDSFINNKTDGTLF